MIDLLVHGDNSPSGIAENIERSRPGVSHELTDLVELGLVERKAKGVYQLTEAGLTTSRVLYRAHERGGFDAIDGLDLPLELGEE